MHLSASSICGDLKEFLNTFQNAQTGSAPVPREMGVTGLQQRAREPKLLQGLFQNYFLEAGIYHDKSKCIGFMVK